MVTAFQSNAFQNNAFQVTGGVVRGTGDFVDYIFQFPDQGSFLRDTTIQRFIPATGNSGQPGVQLLVFNPVETLQKPVPSSRNVLVLPPQLANSTVPLSGFWAMLTIQGIPAFFALLNHPNIRLVNDRTLMFSGQPSVIQTSIDITHINIIINIFGVYVRDGLQMIGGDKLLLEDDISALLLEDAISDLLLES